MDARQIEVQQIMREILQEEYLEFRLDAYLIEERMDLPSSRVVAKVRRSDQAAEWGIEGGGVGSVHAFFQATRDRLADEFPSVKAIIFSSFTARSVPGSEGSDPMDAEVEVSLQVANSYNDTFTFATCSRSLLRASLDAALKAAEYFVNSEKTYIRLYQIVEHHKKESRSDLVDKYTGFLSSVVRNTSYEEVSARLKRGEL